MNNETYLPLTLTLNDASATLEQVGGKGASLARLAVAGLPVPPGFYITTTAYRRFVAENGLQEKILAAASRARIDQPATLEAASKQIGQLFTQSVMPSAIAEEIRHAYTKLGQDDLPVAVRSSATAEDLPEMSFAGQQETYLNMHGATMVLAAVQRCWASLWTARAIGYRARHKIAPQDVSLAVVVQELVPADAAGVLFTANPLTGARDQLMINAAWGLGEAIVSGQVTPDTLVVAKTSKTIIEQQVNEKSRMTVRTSEGTHEDMVPTDRRMLPALSPTQVAELARIGVQIEDLYGQPMDIEWALYADRIFILQARPITALPDQPDAASQSTQVVEWKLPDPKGHYMRASLLELLPDPLSPLFATLGLPTFSKALITFVKSVGIASSDDPFVTINGYGYYDVTSLPTLKLLLAMPRILISVLPSLMGTSQPRWQKAHSRYAELVAHWQAIDQTSAPARELLNGVCVLTDDAAHYYLSVQSGILPAAYMSESLFTLVYDRFLKGHNAPTALTFMLGFDSAPIQAEKSLYDLAQWVRGQPALAAELTNMSSLQFTMAYHERTVQATKIDKAWSQFWQRLADHLARFGHAIYDLDFAKAVLSDDPLPILETLKFFLSGRAPDPYARQQTTVAARELATKTMGTRLHGIRLWLFRRLLGLAQRFAPLREDALADIGLGWPLLRSMLHEIGRRLTQANAISTQDDVFWLTLDELQEATTALDTGQPVANYHTIIAERHTIWEKERTVTPPAALPLKGGARLMGIDFSSVMPARTDQPEGAVLKGIAASPGHVTALARVISGPDEFDQMHQGDILVARITTPAWTPLFALAAGIVTDVGGPLSHSSIVAREYHIPAVLGTGMATGRLTSGQRITVDGDVGTVTLL